MVYIIANFHCKQMSTKNVFVCYETNVSTGSFHYNSTHGGNHMV